MDDEVNETLIRDLAAGDFLDHQRNLVLVGGTGTGKTHLAVSSARACIRNGRRGRFFNVVIWSTSSMQKPGLNGRAGPRT